MRILLDECLPARLRHDIAGHEVTTVPKAGWAGVKNGKLLRLIADSKRFEVFLTMDKNLPAQQKLRGLPFAIFVLRAKPNRFEAVQPLMAELLRRLPEAKDGFVIEISRKS
jgi:predicted nuclease of predicted toxin-antitoxin system